MGKTIEDTTILWSVGATCLRKCQLLYIANTSLCNINICRDISRQTDIPAQIPMSTNASDTTVEIFTTKKLFRFPRRALTRHQRAAT